MPAVIGPKDNDCIPVMRALLQRIQYSAQLGIGKTDAGQVRADRLFPFAVFLDVKKFIPSPGRQGTALGGNVFKIIRPRLRQSDIR